MGFVGPYLPPAGPGVITRVLRLNALVGRLYIRMRDLPGGGSTWLNQLRSVPKPDAHAHETTNETVKRSKGRQSSREGDPNCRKQTLMHRLAGGSSEPLFISSRAIQGKHRNPDRQLVYKHTLRNPVASRRCKGLKAPGFVPSMKEQDQCQTMAMWFRT